jgi:hypothetical protein
MRVQVEQLLDRAGEGGRCALVIDQPGSIGSLAILVARRRGVPVAYVPGLVMRRASELYPGEVKTDRRDSFVLADTARTDTRRSEGKLHNAAIMCLARRRCDVIHAMLRSGVSYGKLPGPARPAPPAADRTRRLTLDQSIGRPPDRRAVVV